MSAVRPGAFTLELPEPATPYRRWRANGSLRLLVEQVTETVRQNGLVEITEDDQVIRLEITGDGRGLGVVMLTGREARRLADLLVLLAGEVGR